MYLTLLLILHALKPSRLDFDCFQRIRLLYLSGAVQTSDGGMTLTAFLKVLQSYQNERRMIMKGCVQWNPVYN